VFLNEFLKGVLIFGSALGRFVSLRFGREFYSAVYKTLAVLGSFSSNL